MDCLHFRCRRAVIKDMASNLERKWRQLLASGAEDSSKRMDIDAAEGRSCQSVQAIGSGF